MEKSPEDRSPGIIFTFVSDGSIHNPLASCTPELMLEEPHPLGNNASWSDVLFEKDSWFYHKKNMWEGTEAPGSAVRVDLYHSLLLQQLKAQELPHMLIIYMVVLAEQRWRIKSV